MFHLLIGLSALAVSWVVLTLPFWLGGIFQVLVTIFCRRWYFHLLPFELSVVGMVWSIVSLYEILGAASLAIYWGIYFIFLLALFAVVFAIKRAILQWRGTKKL